MIPFDIFLLNSHTNLTKIMFPTKILSVFLSLGELREKKSVHSAFHSYIFLTFAAAMPHRGAAKT